MATDDYSTLQIVIGTFVGLTTSWSVYQLWFSSLAGFPGPKTAALSYLPYNYWIASGRAHLIIEKLHQRYGSIVRVGPNTLSVASVKGMEDVYGHRPIFVKNEWYDLFTGTIERPPNIMAERHPEEHSEIKKVLARCFTGPALKQQEEYVQKHIKRLVTKFQEAMDNGDGIDIGHLFLCYTSDAITELAMGKSTASLPSGQLHFVPATLQQFFGTVYVMDMLRRIPFVMGLRSYLVPKRILEGKRRIGEYMSGVLEKRFEKGAARKDHITVMQQGGFSKKQCMVNAGALVVAGSETLANALTFTIYMLALRPDVYRKLREELLASILSKDEIDSATTEPLKYLKAVMQESMRIFPPLVSSGYRISPGTMVDDRLVPAGTECFAPIWTVSRSREYFRDPEEFRPERWISPGRYNDTLKASAPFSLGPRGCIGKGLALMEFRLVLANLCWEFEFRLIDKEFDLIGQSKNFVSWKKPPVRIGLRQASG